MAKWVCPVCGYVYEGENPPEKCPQCGVPGTKFLKQETESGKLSFACEHHVGDGIVDVFVYLVAGSPYLVVFGAVMALIILIARKQSRKAQEKRQSPPSENP